MHPSDHVTIMSERFLEELASLWEQRFENLRDADHDIAWLQRVDRRILACCDGLLQLGIAAWPTIELGLNSQALPLVSASALIALQLEEEVVSDTFWNHVEQTEGARLDAFSIALMHGANSRQMQKLVELSMSSEDAMAAMAVEVLAFRGQLAPEFSGMERLVHSDDAAIRCRAWKAIAFASSQSAASHQLRLGSID